MLTSVPGTWLCAEVPCVLLLVLLRFLAGCIQPSLFADLHMCCLENLS